MIKSKAAILTKINSPLVIEDILIPDQLESGQVLIEMQNSAICGSQIGEIRGVKGKDEYLPHLLGHEGVATVLRIASDVTKVLPGDIVSVHWMKGSGIDANPAKYKSSSFPLINSGAIAVFAEKSVISENRITKISSDVKSSIFSTLGCGLLTSYGVLSRNLSISNKGGNLLILGFGGIGQLLYLIGSKITNCSFSVLDKNIHSLDLADSYGITNRYSNLYDLPRDYYDYVIDTTGDVMIIERAYECLSQIGQMVLLGVTPAGQKIEIDPMPLHFGKVLTGSFGGNAIPDFDIPIIQELVFSDLAHFEKYVFKRFQLDEINMAIEELNNNPKFSRALIDFSV
jgi:S-(hydroxymethyl)glutathione dehydrogenase/alcohol dehydrogenase